jgi:hypothetical protein
MLADRKGSPDGITAMLYKVGEAYDLPPALALPWLAKGYCEQDKMMPGPGEIKIGAESQDNAGGRIKKKARRKS